MDIIDGCFMIAQMLNINRTFTESQGMRDELAADFGATAQFCSIAYSISSCVHLDRIDGTAGDLILSFDGAGGTLGGLRRSNAVDY